MKNKKNFNLLIESIVVLLGLIAWLILYIVMLYSMVIQDQGTDYLFRDILIGTAAWGLFIILGLILIFICYFKYGYFGYWYLDDKIIYSKQLFRKRKIIYLDQIDKVEKKKDTTAFGCSCEVYIIYSKKTKIIICIDNEKKGQDLEEVLKKYIVN